MTFGGAVKYAEAMEVFVLGDEQTLPLLGESPHSRVQRAARTKQPDVKRLGKDVMQQCHQFLRQLLVEE